MARSSLRWLAPLALVLAAPACALVQPGEVGVKVRLGEVEEGIYDPGPVLINPFTTEVYRVPTRTLRHSAEMSLPSSEGVNVDAEIAVLYHVEREAVPDLVISLGEDDGSGIVFSVFRSVAPDVCSQHSAKDMHSGKRAEIEAEILADMDAVLGPRGFVVEHVLLGSITLPPSLADAVSEKLEAEQAAKRAEFELELERQEAERRRIEAAGDADAQAILEVGLTPRVLQWRALEALENASAGGDTTVIITDGRLPGFGSREARPIEDTKAD